MIPEEEEERYRYRLLTHSQKRAYITFGERGIAPEQLEKVLNYILAMQDMGDSKVRQELIQEIQIALVNQTSNTVRAISNYIYAPLSLTVGIGFLLVSGVFFLVGLTALGFLFLLGSAFGFLTYRRVRNEPRLNNWREKPRTAA